MGYILNNDDSFTKVGHTRNKKSNKKKFKHLNRIKKNSKRRNRG